MNTYRNIIKPIFTEKSSVQQELGKYTFEVPRKRTTKVDIKKAFLEIYGVEAEKVSVSILPKKVRMAGKKVITKRSVTKKAIVTTKGGKTVDISKIKLSKKK